MPFLFAMPRPGMGYQPGEVVTNDFARRYPGMVRSAPETESAPASAQEQDPAQEAEDDE